MQQITHITRDISINGAPPVVPAKQGDTGRYVYATIVDKGAAFTIPTGAIALVRVHKPDGTNCVYDSDENAAAVTISDNVVQLKLVDQTLTAAGRAFAEIGLYTSSADRITVFSFIIDIEASAVADGEIVSSDYYNVLTALVAQGVAATSAVINMTVNALTLDAGAEATVQKTEAEGGVVNLAFGIPRGEAGVPGIGFKVMGYYPTAAALTAAVTSPGVGDAYGVGTAAPFSIYIWDNVNSEWVNNGNIVGIEGSVPTFSIDPATGILYAMYD